MIGIDEGGRLTGTMCDFSHPSRWVRPILILSAGALLFSVLATSQTETPQTPVEPQYGRDIHRS
jgi:hypothetical protein